MNSGIVLAGTFGLVTRYRGIAMMPATGAMSR
jgi:hypothetical protein